MNFTPLKIAFHGRNAANFRDGFDALIDARHQIIDLSEALDGPGERAHFESADVIVGIRLDSTLPVPANLRLYHAPAAGTDAIDLSRLPARSALCNCFGHENAIAEYVIAALLQRHVPLTQADADLRQKRWTYWAGRPTALRTELGSQTLGLLGFGHIAQTLARRAKAFGMRVHVANRSPVPTGSELDQYFGLDQLENFMASADAIVVSLPLTEQTRGLVGSRALEAMQPDAVLINVGRGPVIQEQALYDVLKAQRIGGAIIDTWYQYPREDQPECTPSGLDFASLERLTMTPHMSGWTHGTVQRRQQTIADNIARLVRGEPLHNQLRAALAG